MHICALVSSELDLFLVVNFSWLLVSSLYWFYAISSSLLTDRLAAAFLDAPFDPFLAVLERELILILFVVIAWAYVVSRAAAAHPTHIISDGLV